jgi:hypothetical protein
LFSKSLPLETASRLWDCIFLDGEIYIFRAGIALLSLVEAEILASSYDQTMLLLTHLPLVEEEKLFLAMAAYPITAKGEKLLEQYMYSISVL